MCPGDISRSDCRMLNKYDKIYLMISGGRCSTYTALMLKEVSYWITKPIILLHFDTGNRIQSAINTIEKIQSYTGFPLVVLDAKDYLEEKPFFYIKQSLMRLPDAFELVIQGKYSKKVFPCCYWLKHKPFEKWIKKKDNTNDVVISSIRQGESYNRKTFLLKKKAENTRFHFNKRNKVMYYYALRDIHSPTISRKLAQDIFWLDTKKSGCRVCPILALFQLANEGDRFVRTMRVIKNIEKREGITLI